MVQSVLRAANQEFLLCIPILASRSASLSCPKIRLFPLWLRSPIATYAQRQWFITAGGGLNHEFTTQQYRVAFGFVLTLSESSFRRLRSPHTNVGNQLAPSSAGAWGLSAINNRNGVAFGSKRFCAEWRFPFRWLRSPLATYTNRQWFIRADGGLNNEYMGQQYRVAFGFNYRICSDMPVPFGGCALREPRRQNA